MRGQRDGEKTGAQETRFRNRDVEAPDTVAPGLPAFTTVNVDA